MQGHERVLRNNSKVQHLVLRKGVAGWEIKQKDCVTEQDIFIGSALSLSLRLSRQKKKKRRLFPRTQVLALSQIRLGQQKIATLLSWSFEPDSVIFTSLMLGGNANSIIKGL